MNVSFIGIDPSISCTGLSKIRKSKNSDLYIVERVDSISCGNKKYTDRWNKKTDMSMYFKEMIEKSYSDCSFAVIENYSYGSPGQLADLGEMVGLFKFVLSANNIPFYTVTPNEVKKVITGNGSSKKDIVQKLLYDFIENKNLKFKSFDESDSVAVGITYAIKMDGIINES